MALVKLRFIRNFLEAGGPMYVPGDLAAVEESTAVQALRQGAALRIQPDHYYDKALDAPDANKMVARAPNKKG